MNVLQSGLNRVGRFDFVINAPSRYQSFILIIQEFAKFEGIIVAILFIILSFEEIIVVCICNRAEFNSSVTDMKIILFASFRHSLSPYLMISLFESFSVVSILKQLLY